MSNNSFIKCTLALALLMLLTASAYPAFATTYTINGAVVDINGRGVSGATVTLEQGGLQIGDAVTTAYDGSYSIVLNSLPGGDYQLFGEKDGKQSSTMLKVNSGYLNYSASTIMLRNYLVSGVPATPTPTPTPAPTATPTPTPEATAAPENATATPLVTATVEATATATPSATPASTPGFTFVLVPAALALCFIAMRKKD